VGKIKSLMDIDPMKYERGLKILEKSLPVGFEIEDIDIVFTISIGNSFGWAYKNGIHFDVLGFFEHYDIDDDHIFECFLGHELHHRAYDKLFYNDAKSAEEKFYAYLAYEGLGKIL